MDNKIALSVIGDGSHGANGGVMVPPSPGTSAGGAGDKLPPPPPLTAAANATTTTRDEKRVDLEHYQATLGKLSKERNRILDRWADADALGLTAEEVALNAYLRQNLKSLFGETGFNPPVPARNPVSVSMHNPRFSAALWAVNTEAYRRRGTLSRSQKEVVALGVSLANECPHCAYIHTAMGAAAGSDVAFKDLQHFYQSRDAHAAFPVSDGQDPLNNKLASWSIKYRDGEAREHAMPCTPEQVPEVLGTAMLFSILNRVVDSFVSKSEGGPMFPLPIRMMVKLKPASPIIQRLMSWGMSWMMDNQDGKVEAGRVLKEINKVIPTVNGMEGTTDDIPLELPKELSWAAADPAIGAAVVFLASEAELLVKTFVPKVLVSYMKSWIKGWDGGKAPRGPRENWLAPAVKESALGQEDKGAVAMLRLMLVTVVASYTIDDDLLSECQESHGFRGTHAAVHWAAFLAAQRVCQLAVAA